MPAGDPVPVVRAAVAGEGLAIAHVKVIGWADAYRGLVPESTLASFLDVPTQAARIEQVLRAPENVVLVAEREGEGVIGFAVCEAKGRREPLIDSLHVLPEQRRRGLGGGLLIGVARGLVRRGRSSMTIHVVEGNEGARRLYERLGARLLGLEPAPWAPRHVVEAVYRWPELRRLAEAR